MFKIKLNKFLIVGVLTVCLSACSGGSTTSSNVPDNGPVNIGTANNGSTVIMSQKSFQVTQGGKTSGTISIVGGNPNTSISLTFNVSESSSKISVNKQITINAGLESESSNNGITITTLPSPCILGTAGTNLPTSCQINITASTTTTPGTFIISPVVTDDTSTNKASVQLEDTEDTAASVNLSPVTLEVSSDEPVTEVSGALSNPTGIVLNNSETIAYITNYGNNTIAICTLDSSNGGIIGCTDTTTNNLFSGPSNITLNSSGTIAYITNILNNTVTQCAVSSSNGALSGCVANAASVFNGPSAILLNYAGTIAYISNQNNNTISMCSVDSSTGALSGCTDSGATDLDQPNGIVYSTDQQYPYVLIANYGNSTVASCNINSNGTLSGCSNQGLNGSEGGYFSGPVGLTNNPNNLFVTNKLSNTVSNCSQTISGVGEIAYCLNSGGVGFNQPTGIVTNGSGTITYIVNYGNSTISVCPSSNDSTYLGACMNVYPYLNN